jgi:hypothetical protein
MLHPTDTVRSELPREEIAPLGRVFGARIRLAIRARLDHEPGIDEGLALSTSLQIISR